MAADRDGVRRKERDPILMLGTIALVLAFATVGGIYVFDHYIADSSGSPASIGDEVKVDYTGSYYGYYTDDGAEVFDTSVWKVTDDDDILKSFEFSVKTESNHSPLSFTLGSSTSYLTLFMNAAIGLRSGETGKVMIAPADGYGELTESQMALVKKSGETMSKVEVLSLTNINTIYGVTPSGNMSNVTSPYGWSVSIQYDGNGVDAKVIHNVAVGQTYVMNEDVSVNIISVDGNDITLSYDFKTVDAQGDVDYKGETYQNVRLIKIFVDNESRYITATNGEELDEDVMFITKNTDEKTGMYLYFVITRV